MPEGWVGVEGSYSISMPGFVLEQGPLTAQGGVVEVVYDPVKLSDEFLNIDITSRHTYEPGFSDEVFISVLLSGTDASGAQAYAAKLLTLVGDDIYDLN